MNCFKPFITAALTLLLNAPAWALVGGSVDANLASSPWAGVGAVVVNGGGVFSGTLISPRHVLTAAHVVGGQTATPGNVSFVLNAGDNSTETLTASEVSVYPGYTGTTPGADGVWHDDLAVITLSSPVSSSIPAYGLYNGSLTGKIITLVGYGAGGDGVNGVTSGANANIKRVGQNRVDLLLEDDDGGVSNEVYFFDFDGASKTSNVFGSARGAANLTLGASIEAQFAGGDSGGPVFVKVKGVWKIAGIAAFNGGTNQSGGSNVKFGSIGGGTILAPYLMWINSVLGQ
jgi:secreted trypsin-like serine protease